MSTAGNALETISVAFPSPPAPTPPPLVFSIGGTGPTGQVFVSGYFGGYTGGGSQGTSATRCVYMYAPDNANRSSTPTYHDADWPYVELDFGPIVAPASLVPLISVSAGSRVVRINGLPLYLFVGDTKTGACFCDGVDGFFTVRPSIPPTCSN